MGKLKKNDLTANKAPKVTKGAPSGMVISLIVHAVAFFVAGLFVVFTVLPKQQPEFEAPPPVERPKMKLKKPKVKIKKNAKPKPSSRIVAKVKTAKMPEIQLPDLFGTGDGLLGGLGMGGDFMDVPDVGTLTLFGSGISTGDDLVGTFYDFKRGKSGRNIPMSDEQMIETLRNFNRRGWDKSEIDRYYQSPNKLYSTCIMIPNILSLFGPPAFGEDTFGYQWMVLYEGKLVHKDGLKFRFWGQGDDLMLVRVNGEIVLNACWNGGLDQESIAGEWGSNSGSSRVYWLGNNKAVVGDWITLEPGISQDIEVMIGEIPGGGFAAMLLCEVEGVDYPLNRQGGPILPVFRTAPLGHDVVDRICELMVEGEACVTNGPVFCDYPVNPKKYGLAAAPPEPEPEMEKEIEPAMRWWTDLTGNTLKAKYDQSTFGIVYLVDEAGKRKGMPIDQLSAEDQEYIELMNPPEFVVDFIRMEDQQLGRYKLSPKETQWRVKPPTVIDWTFGAKIKQYGGGQYNHELTIEYFALGQQLSDSHKYVLLDHGTDSFVPSKDNDRSHRLSGKPIEITPMGYKKGHDYAEYLVLLIDQRGEIIEYSTSAKWLYAHLDNLRRLPVGAFMNKECMRVVPTGPPSTRY